MTHSTCPHCGAPHQWLSEEAFEKFGFEDGDGLVMTDAVAHVLREAGLTVTTQHWGLHNVIITAIARDGVSLIPEGTRLGYDDPRQYLPEDIVALLDQELAADIHVEVP